jgi:hypothetical protein
MRMITKLLIICSIFFAQQVNAAVYLICAGGQSYLLTQGSGGWSITTAGGCSGGDWILQLEGVAPNNLPPGHVFDRAVEARLNAEFKGRWRKDAAIEKIARERIAEGNVEIAYVDLSALTPLGRSIFQGNRNLQGNNFQNETSSKGIFANSELIIYPNPLVDRKIQFDYEVSEDNLVRINITDLSGRNIYSQPISAAKGLNTNTIELPELPSGIYLFNLVSSEASQTKLFIIK